MRIDIACAQRLAVGFFEQTGLARLELLERRRFRVHFIAEDPAVPGMQAPVFVLFESQGLEHGVAFGGRRSITDPSVVPTRRDQGDVGRLLAAAAAPARPVVDQSRRRVSVNS